MIVAEALAHARRAIPAGEGRLLLQHVLAATAAELAAHPELALDDAQFDHYAKLVAGRAAGQPIAYLTGWREFFGRPFGVSSAVLIPRPETELLVELGVDRLRGRARPRILELGTGSGCIAITLALELAADVTAVDVSADALVAARDNAQRLGATVEFLHSDWYSVVDGRFDLIVANPPYVADGDPHLQAGDLRFEPRLALACGTDGLSAVRRIVDGARRHLLPGGWLLLEHGYDQAALVHQLLDSAVFRDIEQHRDLAGIVRVSGGRQGSA
jgi:release factor glutamine methyltransferase